MSNLDLVPALDAAMLCEVDRATFNRWVAAGEIVPAAAAPGVRGARLFKRGDVEELAARKRSEKQRKASAS